MTTTTIYHYTLPDAEATWTLLATERGICGLLYNEEQLPEARAWLEKHRPGSRWRADRVPFETFGATDRLMRYFGGERVGFEDIPMELLGTPFQREVWSALSRIPYGEVWTYGRLAEELGRSKATRAVGAANGRNPLPVLLPCHRVVGANGTLTGYRGGLTMKKRLLALEGIEHVDDRGHERFRF